MNRPLELQAELAAAKDANTALGIVIARLQEHIASQDRLHATAAKMMNGVLEEKDRMYAAAKADAERYRATIKHVADGLDVRHGTMATTDAVRQLREVLNHKLSQLQ